MRSSMLPKWQAVARKMALSPPGALRATTRFSSDKAGTPFSMNPSPSDMSFRSRNRAPPPPPSQDLDTSTAIAIASELLDIAEEDPPPPPKKKPSEGSPYQSPWQSFFDDMYRNGPTTLGTTDEMLQYEESVAKQQKVMACGIPESRLRFTTTSWGRTMMAPFVQNNEHRVVCKISTADLPLRTKEEWEILQQIVGPRLNFERQELRLTCNQFGSRIENKRHLVSMMDRIIGSCQRLGAELGSSAETTSPDVAPPLSSEAPSSTVETAATEAAQPSNEAPSSTEETAATEATSLFNEAPPSTVVEAAATEAAEPSNEFPSSMADAAATEATSPSNEALSSTVETAATEATSPSNEALSSTVETAVTEANSPPPSNEAPSSTGEAVSPQ